MSVATNAVEHATASPWWNDYSAAYLLRHAIANGAHVQTEAEFFPASEPADDDWFLNIRFEAKTALVELDYSTPRGYWALCISTRDSVGDVGDEMSTAAVIAAAAKLCRDLNNLDVRRRRPSLHGTTAISDEILAMMGDRDLRPAEAAARLGMTYSAFMARLNGGSSWAAADLVKIATILDDVEPTETLGRLIEAVGR